MIKTGLMNEKTLIEFPCQFPIKIFGKANFDFEATVLSIVRKYAPDLGEAAVTTNYSHTKQYIAITVTINAKNQQQLDDLYQALSAYKAILMVL